MAHCPMKFRMVRNRLITPAPRILDIGCGNGSPTVTKRWFPACHYAGADIQRYKLSDADMAAMDEFFPLVRERFGLRRDSGCELRLRDSEPRGGAHARSGAGGGDAVRQAQAGRIYMDCVSFVAQFVAAAFGGRDAAVFGRSYACVCAGCARDGEYSARAWSGCIARGPLARGIFYSSWRCFQAGKENGEAGFHREIFRARDVVRVGF